MFAPAFRALLVLGGAVLLAGLAGCASSRRLPAYEPPLARTEFQTVRTTAYTDTEADHLRYGPRDALGGTLRAAAPPNATPQYASTMPIAASPSAAPREEGAGDSQTGGFYPMSGVAAVPMGRAVSTAPESAPSPAVYGSAAADWSRWPAGTVFRILSTGQLYRIDDYGWALSGRNTIDLYMPSRATMNAWAVRRVPIQIIQWGDRDESLRILRPRDKFRHIKRMELELEGKNRAAARMD